MRTTVTIQDDLYRRTKAFAAETGRTVGEVIDDALRLALGRREPARPPAELPTFGGSGVLPGVDLSDNASLRALMDGEVDVDAQR